MKRSALALLMLFALCCVFASSPTETAGTTQKQKNPKMIVTDASYKRPLNLSELTMRALRNGVPKSPIPEPRQLSDAMLKIYGPLPVEIPPYVKDETYPGRRKMFRPGDASETDDFGAFDGTDHLVSIPSANPQTQPTIATDDSGVIYAAWTERQSSGAWAIMASKSTNGGVTWNTSLTIDNAGTNLRPRMAVHSVGAYTRVHLAYQKMETHTYEIYDTTGAYLGTDTTTEGDVYYARSNNSGTSYSSRYAIANRDFDIGISLLAFHYDESYPDVVCDSLNNIIIAYNSQADEGHIIQIALLIIYIILFEGLPPMWFEYTWYTICYKASTNGGGTFNDEVEVVNDWFVDRWYPAVGLYKNGSAAKLYCVYSQSGFLSLMEATSVVKPITNPFFGPSIGSEVFVSDGYVVGGGIRVDQHGNPKVGITDDFSSDDYDVYYLNSRTAGATFDYPILVDISTSDCFEPRLEIDFADNPFLAWTDGRTGDYSIFTVWSEDGGLTLRSDQHRVNATETGDNQVWPGVGMLLNTTIRRLDIGWWDDSYDAGGDIMCNTATWWRTNINVSIHDSLANPMGGTVTLTYHSFGVTITREINEGNWIVYHDPFTTISVDGVSSGSVVGVERWVLNDRLADTTFTPAAPGGTYNLVYFDQYWTTFNITKGNPASCDRAIPTGITFTYQYFNRVSTGHTIHTAWADVHGIYEYLTPFIITAGVERWNCPSPTGRIMSRTIAPTFYAQFNTTFKTPEKRNPISGGCICSHPVPAFTLTQRYKDGTNIGGTTELHDWTDCGTIYEYQSPRVITETQRWNIPTEVSGIVTGIGPYQPGTYHQWKPSIMLIGPSDDNTTCAETLYTDGILRYEIGLYGNYQPWVDCAMPLKMCNFTYLGWVARDPTYFSCVTSAFMAMIHYGNVVSVTLRNDFGYGFVVADGDTYMTPYVIGWAPSSEHTITAVSPQVYGGTRYVFDHWSDGGEISHMVVPVSDTTFTAFFDRQFLLDVNSAHGTPWGENWYDEGTIANFGVNRYDSTGGIRYSFNGWTGTGTGSYTGTDSSRNVTMNNMITEDAAWNTQYRILVTYTGTSLIPTQTGSGWYGTATMAPISTDSILGDDGTSTDTVRWVFDRWQSTPTGAVIACPTCAHTSVFVDQPYTMVAVYKKQYRLFVYNPDGSYGSPVPAVGAHWVDEGDTLIASVTSPDGSRYCTGYEGTGAISSGYGSSVTIVMTTSTSLTWHWGDRLILEIHAVLDSTPDWSDWLISHPTMGSSHLPGTTYVTPGSPVTVSLARSLYTWLGPGWRDTCYAWSAIGAPCGALDSCWGTGLSTTFTMTENTLLMWHFKQQCQLTVVCSTATGTGCSYDTPSPAYGTHWYDYNEVLDATVAPYASGYYCVLYNFNGAPGFGTHVVRNITGPSRLVWFWVNASDIESLRVISSHGDPLYFDPPPGTIYVPRGWTIPTVMAPAYDYPDTLDGVRYHCTGWVGTGCVPASGTGNIVRVGSTYGVTMTTSGTVTWQWQKELRMRINTEYGDTLWPRIGEMWWPEFSDPICSLFQVIDTTDTGTLVYCTGWHPGFPEDTCIRLSDFDTTSNRPIRITDITCPIDITWKWSDYLAPLYVYTAHGEAGTVPIDTSWWIPGTVVTAFTSNYADFDSIRGERWRCTGWSGTGDVPASGTAAAVSFTIEDTSSITWNWAQEFRVHVTENVYPPRTFGSPSPAIGDHWYASGATQRFLVNPRHVAPPDTYYCTGLFGRGCIPAFHPMYDVNFVIDEPGTLKWQWHRSDSVKSLYVMSAYGSPLPWGTSYWLTGSLVDATVDDSIRIGTTWQHCVGWQGTGDFLPATGDSNHITFTIAEHCTLKWNWSTVQSFTILNPDGWDTPVPPVGTYYHATGSRVSGYITDPVFYDMTGDTHYCVGYYGTGDLPPVSPQHDFEFNISRASSISWRWSDVAVRLDVISSYGSPTPYGTTYWIPATTVSARVDSIVPVSYGIRARCVGWSGTGSAPSAGSTNHTTFTINTNSTITWNWAFQYAFTVACSTIEGGSCGWDSPVPAYGTYWYNDGEHVTADITTNPVPRFPGSLDSVYCVGFLGSGDILRRDHHTHVEFNITQPSGVKWIWAPDDTVARLVVNSVWGNPDPHGTTYWLLHEAVHAMVESVAYSADSSSRHNCMGFTVVGALDSTNTEGANELDFLIHRNTQLTWNWDNQYYIDLEYTGLPVGYAPTQTGEGWYFAGDTAHIVTQTPVYCDASGYYGFVRWNWTPHTVGVLSDSLINDIDLVVDNNYTLTAMYNLAHQVIVQKNPTANNKGWIKIDRTRRDSVSVVVDWWGQGSYHDIQVPTLDSTLTGRRYLFNRWSDGRDSLHRVGPINTDTTFTAYYTAQVRATIVKNPIHNTGWVDVDSVRYPDSSYVYGRLVTVVRCDTFGPPATPDSIRCRDVLVCADSLTTGCSRSLNFWWSPGFRHSFKASEMDSFIGATAPDSARFFFKDWRFNYGRTESTTVADTVFESFFRTDTMKGPGYFIADYLSKWKISLIKMPSETLGYFLFVPTPGDTDTVWHSYKHDFYAEGGRTVTIGVSEFDIKDMPGGIAGDSVYAFQRWSDAGTRIHTIGPLTRAVTDTAFYTGEQALLRIILEPGDPTLRNWLLGTVDPGETRTLARADTIKVRNMGNVPTDLGIKVQSCTPTGWFASSYQGPDKFMLLASFTDLNTAPTFNYISDYVKMTTSWSSATQFGPKGFNLRPSPATDTDRYDYLWLKFLAPTSSSIISEVRIDMMIIAKYRMP